MRSVTDNGSSLNSSHHVLGWCSEYLRVKKCENLSICIFISAFLSLLSYSSGCSLCPEHLKTAWKPSASCRKKTPSYHTVTPTISKECDGLRPKGEDKQSLPVKVQTNCPLWGISQNSHVKLDVWEGRVWKECGKRLCVINLERKKWTRWAKRFPINVNEGLSQKDFLSLLSSKKQEVRY